MRRRPRLSARAAVAAAACVMLLAGAVAGTATAADTATATDGSVYEDVPAEFFASAAISDLHGAGVLDGTECADGKFCPNEPLERWTMAVWLVRVLDAADPPAGPSRFADIAASTWWESHVERLAEMLITSGCAAEPARYCPHSAVTRSQMAAFFVRALALAPSLPAGFADTAGSYFEPEIDALAAAGITAGCSHDPFNYCPQHPVTRAQMALFLHRVINRDTGPLTVAAETDGPLVTNEAFDVVLRFSEPVSGLDPARLTTANAAVTSIAGGGARYIARVEPAAAGTVMFRVLAAAAHSLDGSANAASSPLVRTFTSQPAAPQPPWIDAWNRQLVIDSAAAEFTRTIPGWGYTGDVSACSPGTTSDEFRDSVMGRVNWYRSMAGLEVVAENPQHSAGAQQSALMILAQEELSHFPTADWACYTPTGAAYAVHNIALGYAGTAAVDAYMRDDGDHNRSVGHRRGILDPNVAEMSTGDARRGRHTANTLWYNGQTGSQRPVVREPRGFVAWPPSGYVPADRAWGRWSFSLPDTDLSAAEVAVRDDDGPVAVEVLTRGEGAGGPAIVWAVAGDTNSYLLPQPHGTDRCFVVTVAGVAAADGALDDFEYPVCVLSADTAPGPTPSLSSDTPEPAPGVFDVTVTFSEPVAGFSLRDVHVAAGAATSVTSIDGAADQYRVVITADRDGPVTVTIAENAAYDAGGRPNGRSMPLTRHATARRPSARVTSTASAAGSGPFDVTVTFSEPVAGLDTAALTVINGSAAPGADNGNGSDHNVRVTPETHGAVIVRVEAGAGTSIDGRPSTASAPFVRINTRRPYRARPGIDTWNREIVAAAHETETGRPFPATGFTGDTGTCTPGSIAGQHRSAVIDRINWYRAMAGLSTITEDTSLAAEAQASALMFAANGSFDTSPTATCYSADSSTVMSMNSLWYLSSSGGHDSIGSQIAHPRQRMWLLEPTLTQAAVGYAEGRLHARVLLLTDALWDSYGAPVRPERGFVAWPSPGYAPASALPEVWSFAARDGDLSTATVTVADHNGPLEVSSAAVHQRGASSSIAWRYTPDTAPSRRPAPAAADACYYVAVEGATVNGAAQPPYQYAGVRARGAARRRVTAQPSAVSTSASRSVHGA